MQLSQLQAAVSRLVAENAALRNATAIYTATGTAIPAVIPAANLTSQAAVTEAQLAQALEAADAARADATAAAAQLVTARGELQRATQLMIAMQEDNRVIDLISAARQDIQALESRVAGGEHSSILAP